MFEVPNFTNEFSEKLFYQYVKHDLTNLDKMINLHFFKI